MEPQELMLGNIVLHSEDNEPVMILRIEQDWVKVDKNNTALFLHISEIQPILINKTLLEKNDFTVTEESAVRTTLRKDIHGLDEPLTIDILNNSGEFMVSHDSNFHIRLKELKLHQLQNILSINKLFVNFIV